MTPLKQEQNAGTCKEITNQIGNKNYHFLDEQAEDVRVFTSGNLLIVTAMEGSSRRVVISPDVKPKFGFRIAKELHPECVSWHASRSGQRLSLWGVMKEQV